MQEPHCRWCLFIGLSAASLVGGLERDCVAATVVRVTPASLKVISLLILAQLLASFDVESIWEKWKERAPRGGCLVLYFGLLRRSTRRAEIA